MGDTYDSILALYKSGKISKEEAIQRRDALHAQEQAQSQAGPTIGPNKNTPEQEQANKESWFDRTHVGKGEAVARGLVDLPLAGFGDEIIGAGTAGVEQLAGINKDKSLLEKYRAARDEERLRNRLSQEQHPYIHNATGIGASMLMPFGAMAKAGSKIPLVNKLIPKVPIDTWQAAGQGFKRMVPYGVGASEADLTKGDVSGVAQDALTAGTIGAVTNPLLKYITPTKKGMYESAVAQGGATRKHLKDWFYQNKDVEKIGKDIMDAGGLKPSSERTLNEVIKPGLEKVGKDLNKMEPKDVGGQLLSADGLIKALKNMLKDKTRTPQANRALNQQIKLIEEKYSGKYLTPQEARGIIAGDKAIQGFDESINYARNATDANAISGQDVLRQGRQKAAKWTDVMTRRKGMTTPDQQEKYKALMSKWGNLSEAKNMNQEEQFIKNEFIGARNPYTTIREKVFNPVMDFYRYAKTSAVNPYFKNVPEAMQGKIDTAFSQARPAATMAAIGDSNMTKDEELDAELMKILEENARKNGETAE